MACPLVRLVEATGGIDACQLEAREKRVREEIAWLREEAKRVQAALGDAERDLQQLVDARVPVTEVLAGLYSVVASRREARWRESSGRPPRPSSRAGTGSNGRRTDHSASVMSKP